MTNESANPLRPAVADQATFQAELDKLRAREKAHTREGDAIAAARRRLPMVEVDARPRSPARTGRSRCSTRSRAVGSSSPTTSCGTRGTPRPSSAKAAPGAPPRSRNCPTCIPATSPTRSSARAHTRERPLPRLHGLGHALVLRPGLHQHLAIAAPPTRRDRTWSATCVTATAPSRPTGPPCVASSRWTTATRSWTSPRTGARSRGRTTPPGWPQECTNTPQRRPARLAARAKVAGRTPHPALATTRSRVLRRPPAGALTTPGL